MMMLCELYVDMHYYVVCGMVSSPLHVCGYGFHMQWSYNLDYIAVDDGVDDGADTVGEA